MNESKSQPNQSSPPLITPPSNKPTLNNPPPTQQLPMVHSKQSRTLPTTLYLLTTSLLFADQNLLSPNLSSIATEFNLTQLQRDTKLGGEISIAFFMIGVPAAFIVGCLTDVTSRRSTLFLWVILVGEGACMATYWVSTYQQLYWCRALTGCSVGGALPLIYSVLGDYYKAEERGWVSGLIGMGCGVGISVGQGVAGVLGPRFGWRLPFLVVSIPAIICALLVWLLVGEVERGAADTHSTHNDRIVDDNEEEFSLEMKEMSSDPTNLQNSLPHGKSTNNHGSGAYIQLNNQCSTASDNPSSIRNDEGMLKALISQFQHYLKPQMVTLKALVKCPSVLLAIFQGAGCVPWGIINTYLNDYLSSDRGMSVEGATLVILIFGIGNFSGTIIGGMGSSHIYSKHGPRYTAILSGGAAIAGCFPMWALVNFDSGGGSTILLGFISFIGGACSAITGPIVKSTQQNVTQPQMRGMAFALLNTFDDFGRGLGPAFVAWMIGKLGGRRKAFNIGILGWALCGVLNGLLYFTVERDEERARANADRLFHRRPSEASVEEDTGNDKRLVSPIV